jgi:HAD superfamily hydrolase (TIGR01509 family)
MLEIQGLKVPGEPSVVLCDMDGTATVCTDSINFEATRQVVDRLGVTIDTEKYKLARGMSREKGIEQILKACMREDLLAKTKAIAEEKNRAANLMREQLGPTNVPDADRATLASLRKCGLRVALGSTSRNALDTLNRVQLVSAFDAIVTGNEASEKAEIWRLALKYFAAPAEAAIVIEDSQTGIDEALKLGVAFSVGIGSAPLRATVHAACLGDLKVRLV